MKKTILVLILLSTFSYGQKWQYMFYVTGINISDKKTSVFHVINDGKKVGSVNREIKDDHNIANAKILKQYMGYKYKKAYEIDVLNSLGSIGWELISVEGEGINKKYFFKRSI
jgi:UDP-N-acetylmuramate-alanine ligase